MTDFSVGTKLLILCNNKVSQQILEALKRSIRISFLSCRSQEIHSHLSNLTQYDNAVSPPCMKCSWCLQTAHYLFFMEVWWFFGPFRAIQANTRPEGVIKDDNIRPKEPHNNCRPLHATRLACPANRVRFWGVTKEMFFVRPKGRTSCFGSPIMYKCSVPITN